MIGVTALRPSPVVAQQRTVDLRSLSLEELMSLSVATPSRLPQTLLHAPASAFVLTADDIRRSGATTVAELLRLVPGLHVAQIDGNKWAIGSRGFTDRLARSMLVLIDGRAVYSPLFAGTFWEAQDVPLQDIERLEVIRGPGGALWGANAVNGIINIIRKTAAASAGLSLTVAGGTADPALIEAGYGGGGQTWQYRVSGKLHARASEDTAFDGAYDDAVRLQGGARLDWQTDWGAGTVQTDLYRARFGERDAVAAYDPPSVTNQTNRNVQDGVNLLARWQRHPANPRSLQVQTYLDRTVRTELLFSEVQSIFDLDVQRGGVRGRHGWLVGGSYRLIDSATSTSGLLEFTPANRTDHLFGAFVADEVTLWPDRLQLTVGTKVEHNNYSGVHWQPSARVLWTPSTWQAFSASVARAVRTPSRVEHDFQSGNLLTTMGPTFVRLTPNPAFEAELLTAFEVGWVGNPRPWVMWAVAAFRNAHDRTLSLELNSPFVETDASGARVIVPVHFGNGLRGDSHGVEANIDLRPAAWWRTSVGYSWLRVELDRRPGSRDGGQETRSEGVAPAHQLQLATTFHLGARTTVNWFLRAIGEVPAFDIPSYVTSNLAVEWRARTDVSVFLSGRNLHHAGHVEFDDGRNGQIGIGRSVMAGLRWRR
jgi:iron complex outermembrane receptor protein